MKHAQSKLRLATWLVTWLVTWFNALQPIPTCQEIASAPDDLVNLAHQVRRDLPKANATNLQIRHLCKSIRLISSPSSLFLSSSFIPSSRAILFKLFQSCSLLFHVFSSPFLLFHSTLFLSIHSFCPIHTWACSHSVNNNSCCRIGLSKPRRTCRKFKLEIHRWSSMYCILEQTRLEPFNPLLAGRTRCRKDPQWQFWFVICQRKNMQQCSVPTAKRSYRCDILRLINDHIPGAGVWWLKSSKCLLILRELS